MLITASYVAFDREAATKSCTSYQEALSTVPK